MTHAATVDLQLPKNEPSQHGLEAVFFWEPQKKKKKLHHSSHIRLIRRPIKSKGWNLCS
jgi:hypothetical protein